MHSISIPFIINIILFLIIAAHFGVKIDKETKTVMLVFIIVNIAAFLTIAKDNMNYKNELNTLKKQCAKAGVVVIKKSIYKQIGYKYIVATQTAELKQEGIK